MAINGVFQQSSGLKIIRIKSFDKGKRSKA